jgi:branched-chain amino acid transport system ATP-binding protein
LLKGEGIYKSFGEQIVLNNIFFEIEKNRIYTLIGGNGSGKTTLFNLITGFLKADKGDIIYNSTILNKKLPFQINLTGISRTFQDLRLITKLTVKENILLSFKNNSGHSRINEYFMLNEIQKYNDDILKKTDEILEEISLTLVANNYAGEISYGQQKLLTLGCCLANNPELLLLDEPVAGIDTINYEKIKNIVLRLKGNDSKTILQIEHNRDYIESTTDKILYLCHNNMSEFDNYLQFKNNIGTENI